MDSISTIWGHADPDFAKKLHRDGTTSSVLSDKKSEPLPPFTLLMSHQTRLVAFSQSRQLIKSIPKMIRTIYLKS